MERDSYLTAGDALRRARRLRGIDLGREIPQREIAEIVGKSQQWVASVENGRTELKLNDASKIARYLDIDIADLVATPQELAS